MIESIEEILQRLAKLGEDARRQLLAPAVPATIEAALIRRAELQGEIRGIEDFLCCEGVVGERWRWPLVKSRSGRRYPRHLKYTAEEAADVAELCIFHEVRAGDCTVEVIGHPAWGSYEWVVWKGDDLVAHSDDGFGETAVALVYGLLRVDPLNRRALQEMTAAHDAQEREWQREREQTRLDEAKVGGQG